MMLLVWVFVALATYGLVIGHFGGALLALGMAGFTLYAVRQFRRQDQEYLAQPHSAKCPRSTADSLRDHDCECS